MAILVEKKIWTCYHRHRKQGALRDNQDAQSPNKWAGVRALFQVGICNADRAPEELSVPQCRLRRKPQYGDQVIRGSFQGPPAYRCKINSKPLLVGSRSILLYVLADLASIGPGTRWFKPVYNTQWMLLSKIWKGKDWHLAGLWSWTCPHPQAYCPWPKSFFISSFLVLGHHPTSWNALHFSLWESWLSLYTHLRRLSLKICPSSQSQLSACNYIDSTLSMNIIIQCNQWTHIIISKQE